jgi:hypothetical protein
MAWEREDTERWLNDYPLPADFTWHGEIAWPRYELKHGYGQWLRTAGPYHVALRGLFTLVHDLLAAVPEGAAMPGPEDLAAQLRALESVPETLGLGLEDKPLTSPIGLSWPERGE